MGIKKGDVVQSCVMGDTIGNGFVHYILDDGTAFVEFGIYGKVWTHVDHLTKVEV